MILFLIIGVVVIYSETAAHAATAAFDMTIQGTRIAGWGVYTNGVYVYNTVNDQMTQWTKPLPPPPRPPPHTSVPTHSPTHNWTAHEFYVYNGTDFIPYHALRGGGG
jgi:hypothetical protein